MVWVCLHAVDVVQYPVRHGFGWLARSQLLFRLFSIPGVASIVFWFRGSFGGSLVFLL